jgi:hypothetical protein
MDNKEFSIHLEERTKAFSVIAPAIKYIYLVIPAKAGIQKWPGCRIKSGMTSVAYLIAGLI